MVKNTKKDEYVNKLEKVASMTQDEAKKALLDEVQKDLNAEIAKKIKRAEEKVKVESGEKAREILVDAMRHGATDYVAEYTISTILLPNEEVKGRIIGREGKNIRAFEKETGVELELDDTREVKLSSYDSLRREIAKRSLEILIKDRRIQPGRIEDVVKQTKALSLIHI